MAHYADINNAAFNLAQQATASDDYHAYGSLFQWGRKADGHELINWTSPNNGTPFNGSTDIKNDNPSDALFIITDSNPYDWRVSPDDSLWAAESSPNNVCPYGYRIPTGGYGHEWEIEADGWNADNEHDDTTNVDALASPLHLSMPGIRFASYGFMGGIGNNGIYWSSTKRTYDSYEISIYRQNRDRLS